MKSVARSPGRLLVVGALLAAAAAMVGCGSSPRSTASTPSSSVFVTVTDGATPAASDHTYGQTPPPPPSSSPDADAWKAQLSIDGKLAEKKRKLFGVHMASAKSLSGRLTQDQVELVIAANLDLFTACVKEDTTVGLKALVADTGKVVSVEIPSSTPDNPETRDCVRAAFQKLTFPTGDQHGAPIAFDLALHPVG